MTTGGRVRRALNATTLHILAAGGVLLAFILFTVEVNRGTAIEFSEPLAERSGAVVDVEVRATNTTSEPKCPEVRIAARDSEGVDLAEAVATSPTGDTEILPGERATYQARLTVDSARELDEELDEYAAYVWEMHDC